MNVRGVGKSHKIVKQTDSGFGVDAQAGLGDPSSPDSLCLSGLSRMNLSWMGTPMLAPGTSPGQLIMSALILAINLSFFLLLKLNQSIKKSFSKGGKITHNYGMDLYR